MKTLVKMVVLCAGLGALPAQAQLRTRAWQLGTTSVSSMAPVAVWQTTLGDGPILLLISGRLRANSGGFAPVEVGLKVGISAPRVVANAAAAAPGSVVAWSTFELVQLALQPIELSLTGAVTLEEARVAAIALPGSVVTHFTTRTASVSDDGYQPVVSLTVPPGGPMLLLASATARDAVGSAGAGLRARWLPGETAEAPSRSGASGEAAYWHSYSDLTVSYLTASVRSGGGQLVLEGESNVTNGPPSATGSQATVTARLLAIDLRGTFMESANELGSVSVAPSGAGLSVAGDGGTTYLVVRSLFARAAAGPACYGFGIAGAVPQECHDTQGGRLDTGYSQLELETFSGPVTLENQFSPQAPGDVAFARSSFIGVFPLWFVDGGVPGAVAVVAPPDDAGNPGLPAPAPVEPQPPEVPVHYRVGCSSSPQTGLGLALLAMLRALRRWLRGSPGTGRTAPGRSAAPWFAMTLGSSVWLLISAAFLVQRSAEVAALVAGCFVVMNAAALLLWLRRSHHSFCSSGRWIVLVYALCSLMAVAIIERAGLWPVLSIPANGAVTAQSMIRVIACGSGAVWAMFYLLERAQRRTHR